MAIRFGLYIYPWDLKEAAALPLLEELKAAGIGRLHIAASYHAGKFLRPHGQSSKVYFPEDGTINFHPSQAYGVLKPQPSTWVTGETAALPWWQMDFPEIAAWTVVNHNSRLGWQHPQCCVQNAFGDVYPYSLCPSNPDVRQYGRNLCRDIGQLPVASLQLETPGFLPFAHGYHHEFQLVRPHLVRELLLGLCFCPYCKEIAGQAHQLDVAELQAEVCQWIDATWDDTSYEETIQHQAWQRLLDGSPTLRQYLQWRCERVNLNLELFRKEVPDTKRLEVIPTIQSGLDLVYLEGSALTEMAGVVDRLELPLYLAKTEAALKQLDGALEQGIPAEKISVILRPGYPDVFQKRDLEARIRGILDRGITRVNFYNFGHLPVNRLRDLGQILHALRLL